MQLVVYCDPGSGLVVILTPPGGMTPEEAIHGRPPVARIDEERDDEGNVIVAGRAAVDGLDPLIPQGVTAFVVEQADLPHDADIRSWRLFDGAVSVDPNWRPPVPVPQTLPWWKGRGILGIDGKTAAIEAFIAAMPEGEDKALTQLAWEGADFVRTSPTVIAALNAAGYTTDAQKNDLFVRGNELTR